MSKPRLATFTGGGGKTTMKGYAFKRGPTPRAFFNWNKTFFLLQPPFLSYFASNESTATCLGTVYMTEASVEPIAVYQPGDLRHVVRITPIVRRNLTHASATPDEDNFYIRFESDRDLCRWMQSFKGVCQVLDNQTDGNTDDTNAGANKASDGAADLTVEKQVDVAAAGTTDAATVESCMRLMLDAASRQQVPPQDVAASISASGMRRTSFFSLSDCLAKCYNTEHVHRARCVRCGMSPIFGFMYTCLVCDSSVMCGSCFRHDDHATGHVFLVSPEVQGESMRVRTGLEGAGKPFRNVELVAFEAMFRLAGGQDESEGPTLPLAKRKLLALWDAHRLSTGIDGNCADVPPLSEGDLLHSSAYGALQFEEFMNLVVRRFLLRGGAKRTAMDVANAFSVVRGLAAAACPWLAGTLHVSSPGSAEDAVDVERPGERSWRQLQHACLRIALAASTFDGVHVQRHLAEKFLLQLSSLAHSRSLVLGAQQQDVVPPALRATIVDEFVHMDDLLDAIADYWRAQVAVDARAANVSDAERDAFQRVVVDAADHWLCFELGLGLNLYPGQQLETVHPAACDLCGVMPIVGFRYHCGDCDDYDVCLSCFVRPPDGSPTHDSSHTFVRVPGSGSMNRVQL